MEDIKKKKIVATIYNSNVSHTFGFGASLGKGDLAIVGPCFEYLDWQWNARCLLGGLSVL